MPLTTIIDRQQCHRGKAKHPGEEVKAIETHASDSEHSAYRAPAIAGFRIMVSDAIFCSKLNDIARSQGNELNRHLKYLESVVRGDL